MVFAFIELAHAALVSRDCATLPEELSAWSKVVEIQFIKGCSQFYLFDKIFAHVGTKILFLFFNE